jgi:RNA polymerase sigma-70 factor, ECF subfamily
VTRAEGDELAGGRLAGDGLPGDWLAAAFEQHRDHLRAVAYRLLGSVSDAEDAVQDTWLRLSGANAGEIDNLGGWLTTVVARVSLNMLRSRRRRPELPAGDIWSPGSPAASPGGEAAGPTQQALGDPADEVVLADSVGLALLVVLDTLTPAERLAFVLHDLFAMPFTEVAAVLGRSVEATRQLASRARRRVQGGSGGSGGGGGGGGTRPDSATGGEPGIAARAGADLIRQRAVASAFLTASRGGSFTALLALLDDDVVLTADARAAHADAPVRLRGAERVARAAGLATSRAEHSELALVDGVVGIVYAPGGRLRSVLAFTLDADGLIAAIDVIADPARLRRITLAVLPE